MIDVKHLSKHFGSKVAVDDVTFRVEKGEVLGFLGPNGAGKSTTMRMITGFLPATAGAVTIDGADIVENELEAKRKMGYLPEAAPLYHDMPVMGFLNYAAEIRGLMGAEKDRAVERVVDLCFLQGVRQQSIDTLSKGYRHRTCLAQALIHDPEILILDEPTDGLDPNQKHEVRGLIRSMGEHKAIIFSTHILEEVDAACTRAIIIDRGKVIANGTPEELRSQAKSAGSVLLKVQGSDTSGFREAVEKLSEAARAQVEESLDNHLTLRVEPSNGSAETLPGRLYDLCVDRKVTIEELTVDPGQLDELFRELTTSDVVAGGR